jgi:hypothetical protein
MPSPSIKGIIGLLGTDRTPFSMVIFDPSLGTVIFLYAIYTSLYYLSFIIDVRVMIIL